MGKRVTCFGDCKSPSSAPADGISAGTGFDNTLYNDLWLEDKHRYLKYEYEPSYYKYIPTSQSNYQHYY